MKVRWSKDYPLHHVLHADVQAFNEAVDKTITALLKEHGIAAPTDYIEYKDMSADEIYAALSKKEN